MVFALLIDGDNVSLSLATKILNKISEIGKIIIKKVYLNNASLTSQWNTIINDYSLEPVWVPNNTSAKNAADIALVIDAMDLLCNRSDIEGFCIISSDSDFTRLAAHIVGKNKFILGIGEDKTPKSFMNACSKFMSIVELLETQFPIDQLKNTSVSENETDGTQTFEMLLIQAYEIIPKDQDGWVPLVDVKAQMLAVNPEFQTSDYQNTRRLAEHIKSLAEVYPTGVLEIDEKLDSKPVIHNIRMDCDTINFIEAYKQAPVRERDGWVLLSIIGEELKRYATYENGFSYHGIRNKRLSKIAMEIVKDYPEKIEINEENDGNSVIYLVRINLQP